MEFWTFWGTFTDIFNFHIEKNESTIDSKKHYKSSWLMLTFNFLDKTVLLLRNKKKTKKQLLRACWDRGTYSWWSIYNPIKIHCFIYNYYPIQLMTISYRSIDFEQKCRVNCPQNLSVNCLKIRVGEVVLSCELSCSRDSLPNFTPDKRSEVGELFSGPSRLLP